MTLQEAAGRANLSFQLLSQIERDGQATTTEKLLDLVAVLGGRIEIVDAQAPAPLQIPEARAEIARSFVAVLPFIPDEEIEVFMYELALWHRRYKGEQSP